MPDNNDHDLLLRIEGQVNLIGGRVDDLRVETREIKSILLTNTKRVSHLEGQVNAIWWILGGGGILGSLLAGILALLGRKG